MSVPAMLAKTRAAAPDAVLLHYGPYMYSRHGLPGLVPLWLLLIRRRARCRLALLSHELFVESREPKYGLIGLVQRWSLLALARLSDVVVVTTDERRRVLEAHGVPAGKLRVVRVSATVPTPPPSTPATDRPIERLRVGVFGSLDLERRRLDVVYEALRRLASHTTALELVLIGQVTERTKEFIATVLSRTDRPLVRWTGVIPAEVVSRELAACHASVFFDTHGRQGISSRSTACAATLGLGVPLVGNRGADTDAIFRDGENVLFCDVTPEALAEALRSLQADEAFRLRLSAGGRRLFEKELSWSRIGASISELLHGTAEGQPG
jgi:glycosyltransferase involved in cell wall biosynthesis